MIYAPQNPFVKRKLSLQTRISLNIWIGMIGDHVIVLCIFEGHLASNIYLDFFLISHVRNTWCQSCTTTNGNHFTTPKNSYKIIKCHPELPIKQYSWWIGPALPIQWSHRSPDLLYYIWTCQAISNYSK